MSHGAIALDTLRALRRSEGDPELQADLARAIGEIETGRFDQGR